MRKYELAVILDSTLSKKAKDDFLKEWEGKLKELEAEVEKIEEWGKRKLAYPIKKKQEGFYLLFVFKALPDKIKEFENKLRLEEQVLRYLLIHRLQGDPPAGGEPPLRRRRSSATTNEESPS